MHKPLFPTQVPGFSLKHFPAHFPLAHLHLLSCPPCLTVTSLPTAGLLSFHTFFYDFPFLLHILTLDWAATAVNILIAFGGILQPATILFGLHSPIASSCPISSAPSSRPGMMARNQAAPPGKLTSYPWPSRGALTCSRFACGPQIKIAASPETLPTAIAVHTLPNEHKRNEKKKQRKWVEWGLTTIKYTHKHHFNLDL